MPVTRAIATLLAALALAAGLGLTACGSDSDEREEAPTGVRAGVCENGDAAGGEVRVTGVSCRVGRQVVGSWSDAEDCDAPADASRTSCRLDGFTCLGARTGQGLAVTCAASGRSIAFLAEPR